MKYTRRELLKSLGAGLLSSALAPFLGKEIWAAAEEDKEEDKKEGTGAQSLSITYPPMMASLPLVEGVRTSTFLESKKKNFFMENGIRLKLIPAQGVREAAMMTIHGGADCCITDLSSALLAVARGKGNSSILATAFSPEEGKRHLGLAASGRYGISSLEELVDKWLDPSPKKSIALEMGSDIQYETEKLFRGRNITPDEDSFFLNTDDLVYTLRGLLFGSFVAAVLPEPLLTLAVNNPLLEGNEADLLADFQSVKLLPAVIVFRRELLQEREEIVSSFLSGWREAIGSVNSRNKSQIMGLAMQVITETMPGMSSVIEDAVLPEGFEERFPLPTFTPPTSLVEEDYLDLADWLKSRKVMETIPTFQELTEGCETYL